MVKITLQPQRSFKLRDQTIILNLLIKINTKMLSAQNKSKKWTMKSTRRYSQIFRATSKRLIEITKNIINKIERESLLIDVHQQVYFVKAIDLFDQKISYFFVLHLIQICSKKIERNESEKGKYIKNNQTILDSLFTRKGRWNVMTQYEQYLLDSIMIIIVKWWVKSENTKYCILCFSLSFSLNRLYSAAELLMFQLLRSRNSYLLKRMRRIIIII